MKEEVQKRAQLKRDTENRIQDYRRKIEDLRQSKVKEEMKAKKVINDIAELEEELAHACAAAEETKRELEPVKVISRLLTFEFKTSKLVPNLNFRVIIKDAFKHHLFAHIGGYEVMHINTDCTITRNFGSMLYPFSPMSRL